MRARVAWLLAAALTLAACDQQMTDQELIEPYEESTLFPDGVGMQHPVPGAVARVAPSATAPMPGRIDAALLARGEERYGIFCTPCHGRVGDGRGMIVARGLPQPTSFHVARLRDAPARHFYDVITNGYGVMYAYASRVPPADRWAIIAHIRALQLSQNVGVAALPGEVRAELVESAP